MATIRSLLALIESPVQVRGCRRRRGQHAVPTLDLTEIVDQRLDGQQPRVRAVAVRKLPEK